MRHMSVDPRCEGCFLKPALCMCSALPRIETRTHTTLVIHKVERLKSTNTGRLAARCLANSDVVPFGYDLPPLSRTPWPAGKTPVVLFPLVSARPVTDFVDHARAGTLSLVVLDASWRQANRLRKRFAAANVPFVSCPPGPESVYRLRAEPKDHTLSTLEAIARALQALEGGDIEAHLLHALRVFQDRTLWLRGDLDRTDVFGGIPEGVERHLPM